MKSRYAIGLVVVLALVTLVVVGSLKDARRKEGPPSGGMEPIAGATQPAEGADSGPVRTKSRGELKPGSPAETESSGEETLAKTVRKMGGNPAGSSEIKRGVKTVVALMYKGLIKELNFSEEEADYFKTLAAKGFSEKQELGMKMWSASEEGRRALVEDMTQSEEANDEAIKEFLNSDEDFQRYADYKDRLPERQQIDGILAAMNSKEVPLDEDTANRLIEAMHKVRTESKGPDFTGPDAIEEVAKGGYEESFEQSWKAAQEALRAEVSNMLNPAQLEAFLGYQKQNKERKLMGLKSIDKAMQHQKSTSE